MSSSHLYQKQSYCQSSTVSSTTSTDRILLSRGVRPWKSSINGKRPDHPPALIGTGAAKGVTSADFLLTVKRNQKTLHRQIRSQFHGKLQIPVEATDHEKSHGRDITWTLRAKHAPEHIRET